MNVVFALSHCEANGIRREMVPPFKEELRVAAVVADAHKLTTKLTSALQPSAKREALHRALMVLVNTQHAHPILIYTDLHIIYVSVKVYATLRKNI